MLGLRYSDDNVMSGGAGGGHTSRPRSSAFEASRRFSDPPAPLSAGLMASHCKTPGCDASAHFVKANGMCVSCSSKEKLKSRLQRTYGQVRGPKTFSPVVAMPVWP